MRYAVSILTSGLILASFAIAPAAVQASEKPNLLIMGEDADKDSVPRNSRVFKRVLAALSNQLHDQGFDVFDETAVTLGDFAQGRTRRTDAELIDIARSIRRPPIDVVTIFTIFASADKYSYTTKVNTRIEGRLLHARTGQRLGNFEVVSPGNWRAPVDCNRECILETVGKNALILGQDLGAVLAEKLVSLIEDGDPLPIAGGGGIPNAYTLIFDNFPSDDILEVEEYLVVFSGYKRLRPITKSNRYHEIWYETDSTSARLERNLRKMLGHIGIKGRVTFSGNTFTVEKIARRKKLRLDPKDW